MPNGLVTHPPDALNPPLTTPESPLSSALKTLMNRTRQVNTRLCDLSTQLEPVLIQKPVPAQVAASTPNQASLTVNIILDAIGELDIALGQLALLAEHLDV